MGYKNNVVIKLAQAIIDIQSDKNCNVDTLLEKLWAELDHASKSRESLKVLAIPDHMQSVPPKFIEAHIYMDPDNRTHDVPKGYRLRWALLTNRLWPSGFSANDEPIYEQVHNVSGAEYVDMWLERLPDATEFGDRLAQKLRRRIDRDHMLKTANSFGAGTNKPVELLRLTITHKEFCRNQGLDYEEPVAYDA